MFGETIEREQLLTRMGLVQLVAEEALRRGATSETVRVPLNRLGSLLELGPVAPANILEDVERHRRIEGTPPAGKLDARTLYSRILRYAFANGSFDALESSLLREMRALLGITDEQHQRLLEPFLYVSRCGEDPAPAEQGQLLDSDDLAIMAQYAPSVVRKGGLAHLERVLRDALGFRHRSPDADHFEQLFQNVLDELDKGTQVALMAPVVETVDRLARSRPDLDYPWHTLARLAERAVRVLLTAGCWDETGRILECVHRVPPDRIPLMREAVATIVTARMLVHLNQGRHTAAWNEFEIGLAHQAGDPTRPGREWAQAISALVVFAALGDGSVDPERLLLQMDALQHLCGTAPKDWEVAVPFSGALGAAATLLVDRTDPPRLSSWILTARQVLANFQKDAEIALNMAEGLSILVVALGPALQQPAFQSLIPEVDRVVAVVEGLHRRFPDSTRIAASWQRMR